MTKTIPLSLALCLVAATFASACGPDGFSGVGRGGGIKGFAAAGRGFNPGFAKAPVGGQQMMMAAARQKFAMQAAARRARMKPIRFAKAVQKRQDVLAKREILRTELLAKKEARERAEAEFLASARTWIDRTGKYQVQAQLIAYEDNSVKLKRLDGAVITVPTSKLSLGDIAWVRTELNLPSPGSSSPTLLAAR